MMIQLFRSRTTSSSSTQPGINSPPQAGTGKPGQTARRRRANCSVARGCPPQAGKPVRPRRAKPASKLEMTYVRKL
eukprot:2600064-Rhodomonas_salina.1